MILPFAVLPASNGSADDYNKIITICESDQPDRDAVVVVHELWHMAVSYEHRTIYSNTMEFSLNEGGACLVLFIIARSKYFAITVYTRFFNL